METRTSKLCEYHDASLTLETLLAVRKVLFSLGYVHAVERISRGSLATVQGCGGCLG